MANTLDDYFSSAFQDKLMLKMPEREDDHLTPATRLLEKRREMSEVEQALSAQKEEFQMKMESLQQRREELEKKEYQLKESLLKFDKFLKENDAKRARAMKKAKDELELRHQKEKEILRLNEESMQYQQVKDRLWKRVEKYSLYQKFMEAVLEKAEDFSEVREVVARYETLTATLADLVEQEQKNTEKLENEKKQLATYTEEKHNEIMAYNNELAGLQSRLDKAQAEAVEWETKWQHIKNTSSVKTLTLGKIKMSAHNLYQLMVRNQTTTQAYALTEDPFEQLDKVRDYIMDLTQIVGDIQKQITSGSDHALVSSH